MIMSDYSYEVQYIKGKANTVADCLSRLIAIPEDKWEPLTIEDRDSDEDHPFLLIWEETVTEKKTCFGCFGVF
eukprot:SAG31_NODE_30317_length_382_cov_8.374558_1_plen_73_part_00